MRILILLATVVLASGCTMPAKHAVQAEPAKTIAIKEKPPTFTERLKGRFARKPKIQGASLVEGALRP